MTEPIRILIADDHALVRRMLKNHLSCEPDMTVVADAGNADDAVEKAVKLKTDIVILDIDMPGQHCFEAAREIKKLSTETRIIFLSAFYHDNFIEQALSVEASGYICKTEPPEQIVSAIRTVQVGGSYYSPEVQMRIVFDERGQLHLAQGKRCRGSTLTRREIEVLGYVARGLSKKEMASTMHLSLKTIDAHCTRLMNKLDIHDRVSLARYAIREGLAEA